MDHTFPTTVRPRSVTLTLFGVFLLGVLNFCRVLALSRQMGLLLEKAVQPDPRFRFIMALVWGCVFMGLWWLIRKKRPFTRKLLPLVLILYAVYELGLMAIFAQTDLARQARWFDLGFYLILIVFTIWALNRAAADDYFTNNI